MPTPRDSKLCTADEAAALVRDGAVVASGGFVGAGHAEALTSALERRFVQTAAPRDLTLLYAAGQGDGRGRGVDHLGHEGLLRRVIGGHWGLAPKLGRLALEGKIEAYNFPQGVVCQLFRDIAAGRPGCITHIGLGTYIDPEQCGGRLNDRTPPGLVERVELGGRTWLWYQAPPIDVGLIRATAADPFGNLVTDDEALVGEILPIAQAARNNGGIVLAQVKQLLDHPASPQQVRVPGILVDRIVVADEHEHGQTFAEAMNYDYCRPADAADSAEAPATARAALAAMPAERRIIALRACDEIPPGAICNLGIGMPEGIAEAAAARGMLDDASASSAVLTVESGPIGGRPAGGLSFGASRRPQAIIDQPSQFDFYDGRGLDFAALGAAEIDAAGNVNVAKFGTRFAGVGGFVNITQTARRLVFCGTFTADGLEVRTAGGRLEIVREGKVRKFVTAVQLISFSAARSREVGQEVLYVTERAVFRLTSDGLQLIEVAPGIDLQRDILSQMAFEPIVREVRPMRSELFA
jgi:propionate CoA-transferase